MEANTTHANWLMSLRFQAEHTWNCTCWEPYQVAPVLYLAKIDITDLKVLKAFRCTRDRTICNDRTVSLDVLMGYSVAGM